MATSNQHLKTLQSESYELIGTLAQKLISNSFFLGTAESCTGGLISARCTDIAGSSQWFMGAIVAYSNSIKQNLLSVPSQDLEQHGAVSQKVVEQMAKGCCEKLGVQLAVAVSGIAGPGGGTTDKPVGTVWLGAFFQHKTNIVQNSCCHIFPGSRTMVRELTLNNALKLCISTLEQGLL